MSKIFPHMRTAAYHTQIPLPLFPFRIDWIWQAGSGLQAGTASGIVSAYLSEQVPLVPFGCFGWLACLAGTSELQNYARILEPYCTCSDGQPCQTYPQNCSQSCPGGTLKPQNSANPQARLRFALRVVRTGTPIRNLPLGVRVSN